FGEKIERQRRPGGVRDPSGLSPQLCQVSFRVLVRRRPDQIGRKPELPLSLMCLHQLSNLFLEVLEHFDLGAELPSGFRGDAHGGPSITWKQTEMGTRPSTKDTVC